MSTKNGLSHGGANLMKGPKAPLPKQPSKSELGKVLPKNLNEGAAGKQMSRMKKAK